MAAHSMFCRRVVVLKKKENVEHDVLYQVDVSKLDALTIDQAKLSFRNFNNLLSVSCTVLCCLQTLSALLILYGFNSKMSGTRTTVVAPPVLGKRKRRESLVLQLSGGSESEGDNVSNLSVTSIASSSKIRLDRAPIIVNGKVVFDEKRRYRCVFQGCDKSYTKPCRLEEHERTHTGEVRMSITLYKNKLLTC